MCRNEWRIIMRKKKLWIAAFLLTGTLLFSGCGQNTAADNGSDTNQTTAQIQEEASDNTDSESDTDNMDSTQNDNNADSTTFSDLSTTDLDGNSMDASIFADHTITLVNVWNIGCTPCVNEIPELDKINTDFSERGAAVVGLYHDFGSGLPEDEKSELMSILENANASYTQLRVDGTLADDDMIAGIMVLPTTYIVDSNGRILDTVEGSRDYDGWKSVVESYLIQCQ